MVLVGQDSRMGDWHHPHTLYDLFQPFIGVVDDWPQNMLVNHDHCLYPIEPTHKLKSERGCHRSGWVDAVKGRGKEAGVCGG